jgi:hypothetical protein
MAQAEATRASAARRPQRPQPFDRSATGSSVNGGMQGPSPSPPAEPSEPTSAEPELPLSTPPGSPAKAEPSPPPRL